MTAYPGRDFLLQVDTGSGMQTLGGMRSTSMTVNNDTIDTSNKSSGAWRQLLTGAGIRRLSISAAGVFDNAASEAVVRAAAFDGSALSCTLLFGNGDSLAGSFIINSYERSGVYDAEETYALNLESASAIAFTAAV